MAWNDIMRADGYAKAEAAPPVSNIFATALRDCLVIAGKLMAAGLMILALSHPVPAADAVTRLVFQSPTPGERAILGRVLGAEFVQGIGAFPPEMLVSPVDLNSDGREDMVAVQRGFCSNHACTFHFLLHAPSGAWNDAAVMESWAIPYILGGQEGSMAEVIVFDHRTDDCLGCSPPTPVRMAWRPDPSGKAGPYVEAGPVAAYQTPRFEPGWDWGGRP